jgi:DNA-binding transcriptional ArsR family regulator
MSFTDDPESTPASGTPRNPLTLDDPRMMRALAHPARIAILQHLALDGPATATECAEAAGLSPSACSYHLRMLAAHGFVAEDLSATADRRQRPWRAKIISMSWDDDPSQPIAVQAARRLLDHTMETRLEQIRASYQSRKDEYPAEWQAASGHMQDVLHVTPDELEKLRVELLELTSKYRRLDPAERSPGARRVHAMWETVPWFTPEATA